MPSEMHIPQSAGSKTSKISTNLNESCLKWEFIE